MEDAGNTIQFTPLQPSLEDPDHLVSRLARQYLKDVHRERPGTVGKSDVLFGATNALRSAVKSRVGESTARHLVQTHIEVQEKVSKRLRMDLALVNGELHAGSQALSFQSLRPSELRQHMTAAVLSLNDVRQYSANVELGLIVAPPLDTRRDFDERARILHEAEASCADIGAVVVNQSDTATWAERVVDQMVAVQGLNTIAM